VQGLTVENILVSFENRFDNGQAYVALSRVKSIDGLYLKGFQPEKIRCNKSVQNHMSYMRSKKTSIPFYSMLYRKTDLLISVLNVRSLTHHSEALQKEPAFIQSDIVVCTETWLADFLNTSDFLSEKDLFFFKCDKLDGSSHQRTASGVMIIIKASFLKDAKQVFTYSDRFLQVLAIEIETTTNKRLRIVAVYKSPSSTMSLTDILNQAVTKTNIATIVTGDFNENLLLLNRSPVICRYMQQRNFVQNVYVPTQTSGSCLDHMYTRNLEVIDTNVHFCHFSDHLWVTCNANFNMNN
jgi:hypothetical protein